MHTGSVANTRSGSPIESGDKWNQIDDANVQAGTSFTITGKQHDGTPVSDSFTISAPGSNVSELLTYIQNTAFGGTVTADIGDDGKIQIIDTTVGDSQLEITLVTNNPSLGTLDFGTISTSTEGRSMQVAQGDLQPSP